MSRKSIALPSAILVGALIAAACRGGNTAGPTTTATSPATTAAPTTTAAPATTNSSTTTTTTVVLTSTGPETVSLIVMDYASQPASAIQVTADGGEAPEGPDTPLFRRVGVRGVVTYHPLLAPDGHQLTRAEWVTAQGTATITCEDGGTRYDLEFTGLIPDGVYTIWHFPTTEPITSRLPSGQIEDPMASGKGLAGGALGDANGDDNAFTADAEGNAVLNVLAADRDPIPKCTLAGGTFLVVLYHLDNLTWGDGPGPDKTNASHGVFSYPSLEDSGTSELTVAYLTGTWSGSECVCQLVFDRDGTYRIQQGIGARPGSAEATTVEQGEFTLVGTVLTFISNDESINCEAGDRLISEVEVLEDGASGTDRIRVVQIEDECLIRGSVGTVTLGRVS